VETAQRFLGIASTPLQTPYKVRGFDGKQTMPITHYLELGLVIDGCRISTPMLIVGLGEHNMILGCKWFAKTGVLIDCKNWCLIWPDSKLKAKDWGRILTTTKQNLETAAVDLQHQRDVERQDRIMDDGPYTILQRPARPLPL
jgi:hypothetical protein